jgi:flavin reductase (DIM6/NTAB) family NADH-FMN oxidoreductase RutF
MHLVKEPAILYFGTPVIVISTVNENLSTNLAPISSVFWLGWTAIIGIGTASQTFLNLQRTRECVLNLPSVNEASKVDKLALTTGRNPVPISKQRKGYRYEADKLGISGFTPANSDLVNAMRLMECPVHMEAQLINAHKAAEDDPERRGGITIFELKILRVHIEEQIMHAHSNKVNPDKWRPLIMSFQRFYGLGEQVQNSTLSGIREELYKSSFAVNTIANK